MKTRTRTAALLGAAAIGMAAVAVPAVASPKKPLPEKAQAAKAKAAKAKAAKANSWDRCTIAPDQLLTAADHKSLGKFEARVNARVADGSMDPTRAAVLLVRRSKQITVRVARNDARWAPVFDLFGVEDRKALNAAKKKAGSMKKLRTDKGITLKQLKMARTEGRKASKTVRATLCTSGATA